MSSAPQAKPAEEEEPILDPKTGKPLQGKALKKARRQLKVQQDEKKASRVRAIPENVEQNIQTVAEETKVEATSVTPAANTSTQSSNVPSEAKNSEEKEPVILDPKTNKPLTGKALKKARRKLLVEKDEQKSQMVRPDIPKLRTRNNSERSQHENSNVHSVHTPSTPSNNNPVNSPRRNSTTPKSPSHVHASSQQNKSNQSHQNNRQHQNKQGGNKGQQKPQQQPVRKFGQADIFKNVRKEHEYHEDLPEKLNDILVRQANKIKSASGDMPVGVRFLRRGFWVVS